jgi:signal transduction histidine kinase
VLLCDLFVTNAWGRGIARVLTAATFVVAFGFTYGPDAIHMAFGPALLVSAVSAGAVWLSSVRPTAGLCVAGVATITVIATRSTFDGLPLVCVLVGFQAFMHSRVQWWVPTAALLAMLTANDLSTRQLLGRPYAETSVSFPVLMAALTAGLGMQSRRVKDQHYELVLLRDRERDRAVADERRRIAADIHDIAAHHLTALVVRNKVAHRVGTTDALERAASFTADTAHAALEALRQAVGVLSDDGSSPRRPQPTLLDIHETVQRMTDAGLEIDLVSNLEACGPADLAQPTQVAVVRILQEALANVLAHRGPGRTWVHIDSQPGLITLTVEDDGPGVWHKDMGDRSWSRPGSHGLIGMRERAESCGGSLNIGPSTHGGWRISAGFPIGAA